jgi:oxaloacetate decarboxylase alpha subunit
MVLPHQKINEGDVLVILEAMPSSVELLMLLPASGIASKNSALLRFSIKLMPTCGNKAIPAENAEEIGAPLSGNIWKVMVLPHQKINEGDVLVILEAMKMETEVELLMLLPASGIASKNSALLRFSIKLMPTCGNKA